MASKDSSYSRESSEVYSNSSDQDDIDDIICPESPSESRHNVSHGEADFFSDTCAPCSVSVKPNNNSYESYSDLPESLKYRIYKSIHDAEKQGPKFYETLVGKSSRSERFWFHATGFNSGLQKIIKGPILSEGKNDFTDGPGFYLNPDYPDACQWLQKKYANSPRCVILIYRCQTQSLGGKFWNLKKRESWKHAVKAGRQSWSKEYDWIHTFQNSRPGNKRKTRNRRTPDGHTAEQLIACTPEACKSIHENLIGCIFVDNAFNS